jgi:hypothetical protein
MWKGNLGPMSPARVEPRSGWQNSLCEGKNFLVAGGLNGIYHAASYDKSCAGKKVSITPFLAG